MRHEKLAALLKHRPLLLVIAGSNASVHAFGGLV